MALPDPSPDTTALITGASSGIGAAIAGELAERGHGVALVARREGRLRELAAELSAAHGIRAETIAEDLTREDGRDAVERRLADAGLGVAILVNNAGFGDSALLADADRELLLRMVRLNCEALVDMHARFVPAMVDRGEGIVIDVGSTASFQPIPGNATYAATKAFVLSLGEALHTELRGTGVSVTVLCPGPVRTEFMTAAGMQGAEERTPGFVWSDPDDVARDALDGAASGKRVIVPGLLNRAGSITGQHAPRMLLLPVAKRIWRRAL